MYKSQIGQDKYLDENIFNKKENGIFVEVGAHDGFGGSNTYFFESERNWTGLLIEPNPEPFSRIYRPKSFKENVSITHIEKELDFYAMTGACDVLSGILDQYNTKHEQRIKNELTNLNIFSDEVKKITKQQLIRIQGVRLETLFDKYNYTNIDLVSIDVEGGELNVLRSIDFDKVNIRCFLIENNYGLKQETEFLNSKGYYFYSQVGFDYVFIEN